MINLKYVKKKRLRKIVAFVTSTSFVLLMPFCVLAFIGRDIGHFTIGLKNRDVSLALSDSKEFTDSYTFRTFEKLPKYVVYDYANGIMRNYSDEVIDNEESNDQIGKKINSETEEVSALYFFKHTFYIKNVGTTTATYDVNFKIVDNLKPTNVSYSLDDILRVKWYENVNDDEHESTVYAKKNVTPHFDENGNENYDTCSGDERNECEVGYAKQFISDDLIFTSREKLFAPGEMKRYTLLMWLEGNDRQCIGTTPNKTMLKLSININAFEAVNEG